MSATLAYPEQTETDVVATPPDGVAPQTTHRFETLQCREIPGYDNHELVVSCVNRACGLRALIAIHSTALGPALGGCRMWLYSTEREALSDVLRLSRGMSIKHAMAGTSQGGGKAVIIGDPKREKSTELFRAFGCFIQQLEGRYITAEDVGTTVDDIVSVRQGTEYVAGLPVDVGGSGDPSPFTALGVFHGIQAAVQFRYRRPGVRDLTVAVQGVGDVGYALCKRLHEAGAKLIVTDTYRPHAERACEEFQAKAVDPDEIYRVKADIFAPCALGATINPATVQQLEALIVAGAANNQLSSPEVADLLARRTILYAPDYVINAGGIINIACESLSYDADEAKSQTQEIADTLTRIFAQSQSTRRTTAEVADAIARRRLLQLS